MSLQALLLLATLLPGPARPLQQQDERQAILASLQKLWDGMRTKDTTLLRSAFVPGARLLGVRTRQGGESVVQNITEQQFAEAVARDTRGAWLERLFDPEVRIDGTMATVWGAYDFHLGGTFSHCGTDAFQMLKVGTEWKIASVADTFQREGCPQRPAP